MGEGSPLGPILERWNQLPRGRQFALAGIVAGTIVVLYFVLTSSSQANLVVAYTGLAPEDSAAVADELERQGIAYEIGGGGTTVSVAAGNVAEARIALAQVGLPNGGQVGLEIFDKTNFGATDFVQQVNFRRGLEGELARSINSLDTVQGSRVHIVMPDDSLFAEDEEEGTASVLLQLRPGASLSQSQVQGVANLVSHSVEGLDVSGLTIIDDSGRVLFDGSAFDGLGGMGGTASQLDVQRQYENSLARDITSILNQSIGTGRSAVTVRAAMNFDTVTSQSDTFDPATIIRSQVVVDESFNGDNLTVGGVPGTGTNATETEGEAATGASTYRRTETTTNNEVSRTNTTTVTAPGSVERLSVSVVLDESVTGAQESAITSAVAAAVGLDQSRGDTLSVTRLPFDPSVAEAFIPAAAADGLAQYFEYLQLLLPVLAVVLAFVLVMLLLRSLGKRQVALPAASQQVLLGQGAGAAAGALGQPTGQALSMPDIPTVDPEEERVGALAEKNPRAVADVVQTWIREEE